MRFFRPASVRNLALLLGLVSVAPSCTRPAQPDEPAARAVAPRDAWSVYDLGSTWTDQAGTRRSLAQLRGAPRVVAMIYTHCTATCPIAVAEMKRIETLTPAGVGLVLVSLDPDRDTPGRLASYAAEHGLTSTRWTLLHGTDADVRELAAVLDVRYRRLSPTQLAHGNVLTLLDANGAVAHQQAGLGEGDGIVRVARSIAK